jgi:hypothetical protein
MNQPNIKNIKENNLKFTLYYIIYLVKNKEKRKKKFQSYTIKKSFFYSLFYLYKD